jgi:hypothetical protein
VKGDVQSILWFYADLYESRQDEAHLLNDIILIQSLKDKAGHVWACRHPNGRLLIPFCLNSELCHASDPPTDWLARGSMNQLREKRELLAAQMESAIIFKAIFFPFLRHSASQDRIIIHRDMVRS